MDWVPTMGGGAKLPTLIDFQNEIKSLIERKYATPINRFFIKIEDATNCQLQLFRLFANYDPNIISTNHPTLKYPKTTKITKIPPQPKK